MGGAQRISFEVIAVDSRWMPARVCRCLYTLLLRPLSDNKTKDDDSRSLLIIFEFRIPRTLETTTAQRFSRICRTLHTRPHNCRTGLRIVHFISGAWLTF